MELIPMDYNPYSIKGNPVREYLNRNKYQEPEKQKPTYQKQYMQKNKFVKFINEFSDTIDWIRITRYLYEKSAKQMSFTEYRDYVYNLVISQKKEDYDNIKVVLNSSPFYIKLNTLKIIVKTNE